MALYLFRVARINRLHVTSEFVIQLGVLKAYRHIRSQERKEHVFASMPFPIVIHRYISTQTSGIYFNYIKHASES